MATEIEHKYLVKNLDFVEDCTTSFEIKQGYLSREHGRTIRVRIQNDKAFLTIKGKSVGASRPEYEYNIPVKDAMELLSLCVPPVISKTRYIYLFEGNKWEIDQFHGDLQGLVIAELEIPSEDYKYNCPSFIGEDVTNDPRYFNSQLTTLDKLK